MRRSVLILCTGNLCRSPLAEGILRKRLSEKGLVGIVVRSAGVHSLIGERAARSAVKVAAKHGIDLSRHVSRQVTDEMIAKADLVIGMESYHLARCRAIVKNASEKCRLLSSFGPPERRGRDIDDPYGKPTGAFLATYNEIQRCVEGLVEHLVRAWRLTPAELKDDEKR